MGLINIYEDKTVNHYIQSQFKKMKKKKDSIKTNDLLNSLASEINDNYTITRHSKNELGVKLEKKKNADDVIKDMTMKLEELIEDVDISLLFKIFKTTNEIIVRAKRMIQ